MSETLNGVLGKILIVEDDPDILEGLDALLRHHHYQVSSLPGGAQVLTLARRDHPDLIFLDVMLPSPDGHELCRLLKGDPETRGIPIIFLSARAQDSDVREGLACGAQRYLLKPYRNEELLKAVRELLEP